MWVIRKVLMSRIGYESCICEQSCKGTESPNTFIPCCKVSSTLGNWKCNQMRVYLLTSGCCASSLHRLLMRGAKQGKKLVVHGALCTWGTNHKRNLSSTSSSHWMLKVFCDFKRQSPIHEGKPNGTYLWGEVPHSLRSWLEAFMVLTPLALKRVREFSSRGTHKTTGITWVLMI